jgi:hypothetical protein
MKDHLGYLGDEYVTGWTEQMDYKVQYWEICGHDNGTSPFMTVGLSVTIIQEGSSLYDCNNGIVLLKLCRIFKREYETWSVGRDSDWLRAGPSGNRTPVGERFSASVHTGLGAQPTSYTMDTGSFSGVKRPGRGLDHSPTSSAEVKERVELYLYSSSGPSWPVIG